MASTGESTDIKILLDALGVCPGGSAASIYGILPNSVDTIDSWSGRSSESVEHLRRNLWPGRRVGLRARPAGQPNRRVPAYEETCALAYALNTTLGNHNHNLSPW